MHHADIIASLQKKGVPPVQVARNLNVSKPHVSMVIHGTTKSYRIAEYIAHLIGGEVREIWPGLYDDRAAA